MKKKVVILTGTHLCTNPRVLKEAGTLSKAGYEVTVLGAWLDASLKERDRALASTFAFVPAIDITEGGSCRLAYRARSKLASLSYRLSGIENRWQLGYAYCEQRRAAMARSADLYVAHLEQGMAVGVDMLRRGFNVAVDMEDWFSEDLPPEARRSRPIRLIRWLETQLLNCGAYSSCPSRAMSVALAQRYGCPAPAVIYNAFPWGDRQSIDHAYKDRYDLRIPSIHWFSQTLGQGRGLEDLFAALAYLKNGVQIHLRGLLAPGFEQWLSSCLPEKWRGRISIHRPVANEKLLSRIAEHDIGFAGEMKFCRSRDLTITNKILQSLLGGLAVIASDTAGQQEVAALAPDAVSLYPSGEAQALAKRIDELVESPDRLMKAKGAALKHAQETFCWELQEDRFLQLIDGALRVAHK